MLICVMCLCTFVWNGKKGCDSCYSVGGKTCVGKVILDACKSPSVFFRIFLLLVEACGRSCSREGYCVYVTTMIKCDVYIVAFLKSVLLFCLLLSIFYTNLIYKNGSSSSIGLHDIEINKVKFPYFLNFIFIYNRPLRSHPYFLA